MLTRKPRLGYSLLELLLAMFVVTILGALAVPVYRSMAGPYKLNGAVDSVRGAWAQARAQAMEEGRPYRFAVVPNTGQYRVAPDDPEFWSGGARGDKNTLVLVGQLPRGVSFSVGGAGGSNNGPEWEGRSPPAADPSAYQSPIVFLPDGSAREDAEVLFSVQGQRPRVLCLRGMTGSVSVKTQDR